MSISPIGSLFTTSLDPTSSTRTSNTGQPPAAGQDRVAFSDFLKLIQQLKQLQSQDPAAFKKELSDIAAKLKSAAQQETDPNQSKFLTDLADRFQKAADTGDLSALKPQESQAQGGGHHHHHHSGGAQLTAQTKDTLASIFEDATNTVTPQL